MNKRIEKLDEIVAICGLIFSLVFSTYLIFFSNADILFRYIEAPIFIIFFSIVYLLTRNIIYKQNGLNFLDEISSSRNSTIILNILFFIFFLFSLLSVVNRTEIYSRPIIYFILTVLTICVLAVEIMYYQKQKIYIYLLFIKIVLISFSLRWSSQFLYPSLIGIDPWWHQMFTIEILKTGYIPTSSSYANMPIMHLIIGITSLIANLGYKFSSAISGSMSQFISFIFIFMIGKHIYNEKIGLMAVLLLSFADMQIQYATVMIPLTMGAVFIPMVIYTILIGKRNNKISLIIISTFLCLLVVLSHALASLVLVIILSSMLFSFLVYEKAYGIQIKNPVTIAFVSFIIILMFSWWMFAAQTYFLTFSNIIKEGLSTTTGGFSIQIKSISIEGITEALLSLFGFFLYVSLSIYGSLYMLSKKYVNEYSFSMTLTGYIFLGIIFGSLLMGQVGILPGRWYVILQIIIAIQAAVGVFLLCTLFTNKIRKTIILCITIIILSFFLITDPVANIDTPIYSKNVTSRLALTDSEMKSLSTMSSIKGNNPIIIDQYPLYYLEFYLNSPSKSLTKNIISKDFSDINSELIVIRKEIIKHPFGAYDSGVITIDYDPRENFNTLKYSKVYSSESVEAYRNYMY